MTDFRAKLTHRFRKQQEFSDGYSPLYARLFGLLGDWLEADEPDPVVDWLLSISQERQTLDVTLLLMASLHRDVLNSVSDVAELARYYPTVGGKRPFHHPHLAHDLRRAILARRDTLTPFIQTATVQTNETGRGAAWLLPLLYTSWEAVHLVDLGASAGLNLVGDMRNYRLSVNGEQPIDIGNGNPIQFPMQSHGDFYPPPTLNLPHIISRTGCDLNPFLLQTAVHEQTLAAYIWADQPHRLERLREGIAAFHQVNQTDASIRLHPTRLPDDLPHFLSQHIPANPNHPVVIYNTYMTAYLDDKGTSFHQHIANWAATQNRPILWLQWEPLWNGPQPPEFGWVAWTADFWHNAHHHHWLLAWNHPHGTHVQWQPGLIQWAEFWNAHS